MNSKLDEAKERITEVEDKIRETEEAEQKRDGLNYDLKYLAVGQTAHVSVYTYTCNIF